MSGPFSFSIVIGRLFFHHLLAVYNIYALRQRLECVANGHVLEQQTAVYTVNVVSVFFGCVVEHVLHTSRHKTANGTGCEQGITSAGGRMQTIKISDVIRSVTIVVQMLLHVVHIQYRHHFVSRRMYKAYFVCFIHFNS